jgi:hypothetical protein
MSKKPVRSGKNQLTPLQAGRKQVPPFQAIPKGPKPTSFFPSLSSHAKNGLNKFKTIKNV